MKAKANCKKKNVWLCVGMSSDDAEWLYSTLKPSRSAAARRVKTALKNRIDSASWATTGKCGSIGASLP